MSKKVKGQGYVETKFDPKSLWEFWRACIECQRYNLYDKGMLVDGSPLKTVQFCVYC